MRLRRGAALVFLALLMAPAALAQPPLTPDMQLMAENPAQPLAPLGGSRETPVRLSFSCSVDELVMAPETEILVEFGTGSVPAFATINLNPGSETVAPTDAAHCTDGMMRHYVNASAAITFQGSAPAFVQQRVPVGASLTFQNVNGTDTKRGPLSTDLLFVAAYVASFEVEADRYHVIATEPLHQGVFQINVTNRANGASVATIEVADAAGLVATLPEPLALPYPASEPQVTMLTLTIPDDMYRPLAAYTATILVRLRSSDASANATSEGTLYLTVQAPAAVKRAPGAEPLLALVLVAATVLWRRRAVDR